MQKKPIYEELREGAGCDHIERCKALQLIAKELWRVLENIERPQASTGIIHRLELHLRKTLGVELEPDEEKDLDDRVLCEEFRWGVISKGDCSIQDLADIFQVSKSTAHKWANERQ